MEHNEQEEDAGFEAGFAAEIIPEPTEAPAPAPAPAPAASENANAEVPADPPAPAPAEPKAQQPSEEIAVDDPFANLPAPVRDLLAKIPALEQRTNAAETIARTAQGRVASLQSQLDRQRADASPAPTPATPKFQKLEALRDQLPEVAEALDEIVASPAPAAAPTPAPPPNEPTPQRSSQQESDPQSEVLDELRPNWAQELMSSDFQLWLSTQPADYQRTVNATDKAAVIIGALNKHGDHVKQSASTRNLATQRQQRMAAAVVPPGDGRRSSAAKPQDDEDAAFEAGFSGR